jgi:HAD superfamily hydrolase (TIGR01509 family)
MTLLHPPGASVDTVLLDIDGTLIDSNDAHARAWVAAFVANGYIVPFAKVRPLIGMGGDKLLPQLTGLDPESAEAQRISAARGQFFREELPTLQPTAGARELLVYLKEHGFSLVVATSAQADEVTAILRQAGVADLIEAASSSDDADSSKPDPDIVQAAMHKAKRHPSQCVMLGDTPYDIEAAGRARVPCIALRCGGGWTDAALADAIAIYDHPADLLAHVRTSPLAEGGAVA